ncbi:acyl-CoA dehydrogenase family protein [Streptomyces sp. NRRL S-87]|uniref:acyl-CoA dehydrogenase family protein n=1 Tax=Streptomyces sp. NRRL S-87 TaxID=1463920 RepID=UPI0006894947|nr:acyl-CoA dehydrogenase family protein [Streptomyces sp. NRRL S-87]
MHFQLSEDQLALRAGMRELLAARFGPDALRAALDRGAGFPRGPWRDLGEAGFFALRVPEAAGGLGLGLPEAVLVFEEAGRALLPGPLVATELAAAGALVPGAATGEAVVTAVDIGAVGGGYAAHLADSDAVLGEPGPVRGEPVAAVDPLTPLHRVRGAVVPGRWRAQGALLTAALQLGSAARSCELAVRYAGEREQFGQPVGGFQAVKHLCADMLVRAELARAAVYAAAVTGTVGEAAGAKLLADEAAVRNARDCLQVHGGMGFTWEADVHLHLKRAWLRARQWWTAGEAEELLAAELAAGSPESASSAPSVPRV